MSRELPQENEAVVFVEQHRDFLEHYARGKIKIAAAPEGLDTFAFDLKENTIFISPRFYKELGLSEERTTFATLHEIEHMLEKIGMLAEKDGAERFEGYMKKIEESRAYGLMDNCVADIRENRTVISKTNKGYQEIEQGMYREDLFKENDFTKMPMHVQLPQALLVESRDPGRKCNVAPEVRQKLDELTAITGEDGTRLLDAMTDPETPMSLRQDLQDEYIWPLIEELKEKDVENEKKKKEEKGKGEKGNTDEQHKSNGESNPNEMFKDAYDEADKNVPNAVPLEAIKKAFEEWKAEKGEDPLDTADAKYAEKIGVQKKDLQEYRKVAEELGTIINPETQESVIEELRQLFARIISKRLKPAPAPRYPVEDGEDLVDPAELVAEFGKGNLEPKVWETHEFKERKGAMFGKIEVTFVFDRSTSMDDDGKLEEQRKAGVMGMEALKEFNEMAKNEETNLEKSLSISSEIYSFQASDQDSIPRKQMSTELGEKERIEVFKALSSTSGSTTDFVPLEVIDEGIDKHKEAQIRQGELKKIVIVFTDGGSNEPSRVHKVLENLRSKGTIVVGIGITPSGAPALVTYAPEAQLAETAEKLPVVLGKVLKDHLSDI